MAEINELNNTTGHEDRNKYNKLISMRNDVAANSVTPMIETNQRLIILRRLRPGDFLQHERGNWQSTMKRWSPKRLTAAKNNADLREYEDKSTATAR